MVILVRTVSDAFYWDNIPISLSLTKDLNLNEEQTKILKDLNLSYVLITYFYIERALHELKYEILFRPNKIIVPVLGLREIVEKN